MTMKRVLYAGLMAMLICGAAFARLGEDAGVMDPYEEPGRDNLDVQCTIDYIGFQYIGNGGAGGHGNIRWTGGYLITNFGSMMFLNSCTNDTMYAFCNDLDHSLNQAPYCANIDPAIVNPLYPEQYKAMGYVQTWYTYSGTTEQQTRQDDILQLAIWKLSSNEAGGPTHGVPFYRINAGRGWPDTTNAPVFPYVNTVFGTNTDRNTPANDQVRFALGATDGIPKNIILCGDDILYDIGSPDLDDGFATVPITLTIQRGANSQAVGNTTLGGIKIQISTDLGTLSATEVFTNAAGQATITITQPVGTPVGSNLHICSRGAWPKLITRCNGQHNLQFLVQKLETFDICEECIDIPVPPANFLPVELLSFAAYPGDENVMLRWMTASEQNSASFRVIRDGGMIHLEHALNSPSGGTYQWTDNEVANGVRYVYTLIAVDITGEEQELETVEATPNGTAQVISEFSLGQNTPNPFNPETSISFTLPKAGITTLGVYDITGRLIQELVSGEMEAGLHRVQFNGGELPSGVYFYKLEAEGFSATKKMVLMR